MAVQLCSLQDGRWCVSLQAEMLDRTHLKLPGAQEDLVKVQPNLLCCIEASSIVEHVWRSAGQQWVNTVPECQPGKGASASSRSPCG